MNEDHEFEEAGIEEAKAENMNEDQLIKFYVLIQKGVNFTILKYFL